MYLNDIKEEGEEDDFFYKEMEKATREYISREFSISEAMIEILENNGIDTMEEIVECFISSNEKIMDHFSFRGIRRKRLNHGSKGA